MTITIRYGVAKTRNVYEPVMFVGDQTSSYSLITRKTAAGALRKAEQFANEEAESLRKFGNEVTLVKWQHSVI
jgi:hypothetical protein